MWPPCQGSHGIRVRSTSRDFKLTVAPTSHRNDGVRSGAPLGRAHWGLGAPSPLTSSGQGEEEPSRIGCAGVQTNLSASDATKTPRLSCHPLLEKAYSAGLPSLFGGQLAPASISRQEHGLSYSSPSTTCRPMATKFAMMCTQMNRSHLRAAYLPLFDYGFIRSLLNVLPVIDRDRG